MTGDYHESYSNVSGSSNNMLRSPMLRPQSPQHLDSCLDVMLDDLQATVSRPGSRLDDHTRSSTKRYTTTSTPVSRQYGESQKNQVQEDIDQLVQLLDHHGSSNGMNKSTTGQDTKSTSLTNTNLNLGSWNSDMNAGDMTYTRTETITRDRFGTDSSGRIYRDSSPLRLTGPGAPALNAPSTTKSFVVSKHKVDSYVPHASNKMSSESSREGIEYNIPITHTTVQGPGTKTRTIETSYSYEVQGDGDNARNFERNGKFESSGTSI
ncbi:uncharacterized protein LOC113375377 [Ctenocephalides felis]|uniref:uncharacterized protein LOC113375377 n=1 Tax=Ctenocephalides felis TaxID=7515 RepID=UPI000E6E5202|nr:uncharacterized protein LOC113375377 [Ctenocephalides felis]